MNKQYIDFQITHQRITRTDSFEVVGGSKGYLHARFSFCEDWADEKVRIAIFTGGGVSYPMPLENDTCEIPWEVLRLKRFYVGCVAGELLTSDAEVVEVKPCGADLLNPSLEPTPTMFVAILKKLEGLEAVTDEEIAAAVEQYMQKNSIDINDDIWSSDDLCKPTPDIAGSIPVVNAQGEAEWTSNITLGQHTDGLIYIFIGGKPVGNGLSIASGEVVEPVYGQPIVDNAILSIANGQTVQLGVKLDEKPTQEQTITVLPTSIALAFDKTSLKFTPENWNEYQFVGITAGYVEEDTTATIILQNSDKLLTDTNITVYLTADDYAVDTTIPTDGRHIVTAEDFESVTAMGSDKVHLGAYTAEYTNIYVPSKLTVDGIEKSVILRGRATFQNNTTLQYVTVADGVYASLHGQAYKQWSETFSGCANLIGVKYEGTDIETLPGTFKGCTSLKFFDGLTNQTNCTDMQYIFDGCTALEYLPDLSALKNLTRILYAFQNCSSLKKIYGFPDALASPGSAKMAFYNTALKYVKIPANVNDVFYCCAGSTALEKCEIYTDDLDSTKNLTLQTFQNCGSLTVYCNAGTTTEETLRSVYASSTNIEVRTFGGADVTPTIAVWGDSTSSPGTPWGCWPDRLQEKVGLQAYFVKNQAVSGETTTSTSARQGGNTLRVGAFTIPSDMSLVEIALTSADGQAFGISPVFSAGGGFNPCTIAGIEGSIVNVGGVCKFGRKTAGDSVEVADGSIVTSNADSLFNNAAAVMLVNLGINAGWNGNPDTLLNQVRLMVNHFTESGGTKYIITGAYAGQFMRNDDIRQKVFEYETKAATLFGEHWMNLREYLIANGLAENGLTASALDNERIAVGQVPASLLGAGTVDDIKIYDGKTVTDDTHPNAYGANSICNAFYAKGKALGYWGESNLMIGGDNR